MKVPKIIFELAETLKKHDIDYRIGGGQAAVFYGLRDRAEDWDLAIQEVTPELKEAMESLDFVKIPDSDGLSWEGPTLVDFIVADGKEYPTLEELGVHYVEGLKFVARSMMGYINWKEGESAYQHLKDYREMIEGTELPEPVQEFTDLKRFRESSLCFSAKQQQIYNASFRNIVHFSMSPSGAEWDEGVIDFRLNSSSIKAALVRLYKLTRNFKMVVADVRDATILTIDSHVKEMFKIKSPYQTASIRGTLLSKGIQGLSWPEYGVLQIIDPDTIYNVRKYDSSQFKQVIDETEKKDEGVDPQEEIVKLEKQAGSKKMSVAEKLQQVAAKLKKSAADLIPGGLADDQTVEDLAEKHDTSTEAIEKQLEIGTEIEKEHTDNEEKAKEIAEDHVYENDKYYHDPRGIDLVDMEKMAEERMKAAAHLVSSIVKIASKLEEDGLSLEACLMDRLIREAGLVTAYEQDVDYRSMADTYRKQRIGNQVLSKATGVPADTVDYYRKLEPVLKNFAKLLEQADQLDKGSQKYIEIVRHVQDAFNTKYDPYNTDHVPTKIKYILELLKIDDIIRHNLDKIATPEQGEEAIIEKFVAMLKDQGLLKEFNSLKKAIS